MPAQPKDLLKHFDSLKADRTTFDRSWQEIAEFELGRRDFQVQRQAGEARMRNLYDTTALLSGQLLAGALHSLLTNSSTKWFRLRPENRRLLQIDSVRFWLEFAEERILDAFNRPQGGFNANIHEFYTDLSFFATGGMFVTDEPGKGTLFSARPLGEIYVDEDASGRVSAAFREVKLTARQSIAEFGNQTPDRIRKSAESGSADEKFTFIHAIVPNREFVEGAFGSLGMAWESQYLQTEDGQRPVSIGGYHEMPLIVARWSKDPGEKYGRGPGWTALADAKMLNEIWKTTLKAAQKVVDPPLLVDDDGVLSGTALRTQPGGTTVVRPSISGGEPVRPLVTNARIDLGIALIEQKAQNIRSAFHAELLPLFQGPAMTATQVLELANQAQRFLSPLLGRLQPEALDPMVDRVFGIELRAGRLPPPPPELLGAEIRAEYVSPVARAQNESESRAILEVFEVAAGMGQAFPAVLDKIDSDEGIERIAQLKGIPAGIIRDARLVSQIREGQRQLAAAQEEQAQIIQGAETGAKVIQAIGSSQAAA